jgi:integrase
MSPFKKVRADGKSDWYYDFTFNGQRFRGLGGSTRLQALRVQEKVRDQVISGNYSLSGLKSSQKFDEFAKLFLYRSSHLKSIRRVKILVKQLGGYYGRVTFIAIKSQDIEDYKMWRKSQGVSNATVNREIACLKRMFNLAIKWGKAAKNPVNDVDFLKEPPGRTRFLTVEEMNRLLDVANPNLRPIIFTALNTGMRLMEILRLKWTQVLVTSVIEPCIHIPGQSAKNNKDRWIPLNDDMILLLENLHKNAEYVFLNRQGIPYKSVRTAFCTALRKAGISDFRFHDLRHTFASHFAMNVGDLLTLKEILGHSSMEMVQRYAHLAAKHKRKQINCLTGMLQSCHLSATNEKCSEKSGVVNC